MNTPDTYPTIEAALADLQTICGTVFLGDLRHELREMITKTGLSRKYVADLATEVVTEIKKSYADPEPLSVPRLPADRPCADCPKLRDAEQRTF